MTGYLAGPVDVLVPYSVLFLADPHNPDAETPEHARDTLIGRNDHCISIGVCSGELEEVTRIALSSQLQNRELRIYFSGEIMCTSGILSVSNAELEDIISVSGQGQRVRVSIYADGASFAQCVEIVIG